MDDAIHIAVVGCGYWGPNLTRNFSALPGCRLRIVCDRDRARLDRFRLMYPQAEMREDADGVVEDPSVDAVVIATPLRTHYRLAKASLRAGKHTFIEKPMAASGAECEELIGIAADKGLTLMVGHTFLYSPAIRKIKEIVGSGDIGKLLYMSARRLNLGLFQKDMNVVWDLAPHDISIIRFVIGEEPVAVNCHGASNVTAGIEDVSNLTLHFAGGRVATIHSSWLDPKKVRDMAIVGSRKMIHYDDLEPLQKIKIYDQRVEKPPHWETFGEFQYAYHYGDMHAPYLKQEEPLKVECLHFLDCIRTGKPPLSDGLNGLTVVRVLEAASRSLQRNGARVDVAPAPKRRARPRSPKASEPVRRPALTR